MKAKTENISWYMDTRDIEMARKHVDTLKKELLNVGCCGGVNYLIEENDSAYTVTLNTSNFPSDTAKRLDFGFVITEVAENIEEYKDFIGLLIVNK